MPWRRWRGGGEQAAEDGESTLAEPLVNASDWQWGALLWLTVWNETTRFLHVPKTGGTMLSRYDSATLDHFQSFGRATSTRHMFIGLQRLAQLGLRVDCNGAKAKLLPAGCSRCQGDAVQGTHHLTPEQLQLCGVHAPWSPYVGHTVYCIVRDPVQRFVSNFLWAVRTYPSVKAWPSKRCGDNPGHRRGPVAVRHMLSCFTRESERILRRWQHERAYLSNGSAGADQSEHVWPAEVRQRVGLGELLLHIQPQADYLRHSSTGAPTCHIVFHIDDVRASGIGATTLKGKASQSESAVAEEALRENSTLMAAVSRMYQEDFLLVERVKLRLPPTSAHTSLIALAQGARRRWPGLLDAAPQCDPSNVLPCTCRSCCRSYLAARLEDCMSCFLASPLCAAAGSGKHSSQFGLRMAPRALAPFCTPSREECNTCAECCARAAHVPSLRGFTRACQECDRVECNGSATSTPPLYYRFHQGTLL